MILDMDMETLSRRFKALGNTTRLGIYRYLVRAGPLGRAVADIQERLEIPGSTLSHHLHKLIQVGLVKQVRRGRTLICQSEKDSMYETFDVFIRECCTEQELVETAHKNRNGMTMSESIQDAVRKGYGAVAASGLSSDSDNIKGIAKAFGYSEEELASIPAASNMGLSCGNPVAMASIREGETVVDLGSGGGLDVFLASKKVGPTGLAIGVDMTGEMVSLARRNAKNGGYENVKFYLGEIEAMPIPSNSVDCVISNCVLNLCEDKLIALKEIHRILKPGGRLAVSDIALKQELPANIAKEIAAWTGCIAGAMSIDENKSSLLEAGFSEVEIVDSNSDLNAYRLGGHAACCGPESEADMSAKDDSAETAESSCCAPKPEPKQETSCCGPKPEPKPEPKQQTSCCGPEPKTTEATNAEVQSQFHDTMSDLLDDFDINAYAASVKIFALKPVAD